MGKFEERHQYVRGKLAEQKFNELVNGTFSSTEEDIFQHFDITINLKIDVKGMKKIRAYDLDVSDDFHYVEIKGTSGHLGWLYGKADYIAFEMRYQWLLVPLIALQDLIHTKCQKILYDNPKPYHLYSRGKDLMTLVPVTDLISIASNIIQKYGKL